jgi:hypothetical protein
MRARSRRAQRRLTFENQKKLGVIPQDAEWTPRPDSIPSRESRQLTWTTGWSRRVSIDEPGPSGARHVAPSTCRHQGACATARVGGKSSGSRR